MTTATQTITKNRESNLENATNSDNLDTVLKNVKKLDTTCAYTKCKNRTADFAIQCKYCNNRFCTSHGLQEIHGCGEAVKRDEKRNFVHPKPKLSQEKHTETAAKLSNKLKQMQFERKAKQCSTKGKKN